MAAKNVDFAGDVGPRAFVEWVKSLLSPDGTASDAYVAKTIGISASNLTRYRSDLTLPSLDVIRRAADTLNVPIIAALMKAGVITPEEADVKVIEPTLAEIPTDDLFNELKRRVAQPE